MFWVLKHKGVIEANSLRHYFFVKVLQLQVKKPLPLFEIDWVVVLDMFWTYWRPATQICDLEGHDVPLSVRYIIDGDMLRISVYVWKITVFIYFLANENHSTCKQWRRLDLENGITAVIFVTVRGAAYELLCESWSWLLQMKLQTIFSKTFL